MEGVLVVGQLYSFVGQLYARMLAACVPSDGLRVVRPLWILRLWNLWLWILRLCNLWLWILRLWNLWLWILWLWNLWLWILWLWNLWRLWGGHGLRRRRRGRW